VWAGLLAGAVAVIVTVGNPTEGHSRASFETWTMVIAILGPILLACLAGARVWRGPAAAVLLAVVSGALWGVFAVLTKGVVHGLDLGSWHGVWHLLRKPELYVWGLVALAGTALQQSAFRAGSLTASLPTMTIAEPVVGSVLGIVVLGETLRPGDAGLATLVAAAVVMVVAAAALARGEAATAVKHDG
jgi:drug/metabolite transporter (DMT)-like permease